MQTESDRRTRHGSAAPKIPSTSSPTGSAESAAVALQLLPGLIAGYTLVDAVGLDQPANGSRGSSRARSDRLQGHQNRVAGLAVEGPVELLLEPVQRLQAIARERVAELVHEPGEAVDREQVRA